MKEEKKPQIPMDNPFDHQEWAIGNRECPKCKSPVERVYGQTAARVKCTNPKCSWWSAFA